MKDGFFIIETNEKGEEKRKEISWDEVEKPMKEFKILYQKYFKKVKNEEEALRLALSEARRIK